MDVTHVNDGKDMKDITNCVICERRLSPYRSAVDTCGRRCFQILLELQCRQIDASADNR